MFYPIVSVSRRIVVADESTGEYHLLRRARPECGIVEALLAGNLVGFVEEEPWLAEKANFGPCPRCVGL